MYTTPYATCYAYDIPCAWLLISFIMNLHAHAYAYIKERGDRWREADK